MKRKGMTAGELLAQLNADPDWAARKEAREEDFLRKREALSVAEAPLLLELRAAGATLDSVWDLVNQKQPAFQHAQYPSNQDRYSDLAPILLDHLARPYPDAIRDGIARALAVPAARFGWSRLVDFYRKESGPRTKQGLAVALANTADDGTLGEVIELAKDARQGESRALLLGALERSRLPKATEALAQLSADPELTAEVQRILRKKRRLH